MVNARGTIAGGAIALLGVAVFLIGYQVSVSAWQTANDLNYQYQKYCTIGQYIDPQGCAKLLDGYHAAVNTMNLGQATAVLGIYVMFPLGLLVIGVSRARTKPALYCPTCGNRYRAMAYCPQDATKLLALK